MLEFAGKPFVFSVMFRILFANASIKVLLNVIRHGDMYSSACIDST